MQRLDAFLNFNEREVLSHAGQVSKTQADAHAEQQYEQYAAQRRARLEAEGEEGLMKTLEAAVKDVPAHRPKT